MFTVHCPTQRQVPPVVKSIFIFRTLTPNNYTIRYIPIKLYSVVLHLQYYFFFFKYKLINIFWLELGKRALTKMGLSSKQRKWTWAIFGIFKSFVTFHEHGESSIETFGFWLWIIHQFLIGWCVSGIRWARSLQFLLIPHKHFERTIEAFLFDSPYTIS